MPLEAQPLTPQALFASSHRVHFIGIGGIGMSGIAEILLTMGYPVSGSDQRASPTTKRLQELGAQIFLGHLAANVADCDVVVATSAVSSDNPEVLEARRRHIPVIQRAEMLAELMRLKYGIAIAGMHGKTTTTSMVAAVLSGGELDPTVVVGGRVDALGSNARLGRSRYLVAEADESDRSFLKLSPVLAVVTNLDREHMESYADMADVEACFVQFMDKVPFYGAVTACIDDPMLRPVLDRVHRRVYTYGTSPDADFQLLPSLPDASPNASADSTPDAPKGTGFSPSIPDPRKEGASAPEGTRPGIPSTFHVKTMGKLVLGPFTLHVPGHHNLLNATAAVAIGIQLGLTADQIALGLASFRGVDRRFQARGNVRNITVVDDYGHHPTEIRATLQAARECGYARVLVLFQPHRYTRTRDLMPDFAAAFGEADLLEVLDIYAASEPPIEGISGQSLADAIAAARGVTGRGTIHYAGSMEAGVARLATLAQPGDLIITLGAGSISQAGPLLLEKLQSHPPQPLSS